MTEAEAWEGWLDSAAVTLLDKHPKCTPIQWRMYSTVCVGDIYKIYQRCAVIAEARLEINAL